MLDKFSKVLHSNLAILNFNDMACLLPKFIVWYSNDNFSASSSPQAALKAVEGSLQLYLFISISKKLCFDAENGKLLP